MTVPPRFNVQGVGIHALTLPLARDLIVEAARDRGRGHYVCCCDAHSISWAHRSMAHRRALRQAFLATPDGMPLVWTGRRSGYPVERVYGPDLLLAICAATADRAYSHFFYGAGPGTAERLTAVLQRSFPGLRIAGTYTPPFGPLPEAERTALVARLQAAPPDFFWVSLSTPKQEAWVATNASLFPAGVMLAVGAAFDLLSGRVRQAPKWCRELGAEWLWRLAREPRRLAPRYLRSAPLFALRAVAQATGLRRYPLE
ncbi:MAG TPA: WecB/TagA/CpsF family glycosyltransferase [Candidatus Synoicihabitans sp.]|nr:WecB/TagA/CpsF family glycosyltransferase [Candidatus Synoicihabitans sp.]